MKIVTSFTVAHSFTLVLATLGILTPNEQLVEAGIALSIAYIGLENLRLRGNKWVHSAEPMKVIGTRRGVR